MANTIIFPSEDVIDTSALEGTSEKIILDAFEVEILDNKLLDIEAIEIEILEVQIADFSASGASIPWWLGTRAEYNKLTSEEKKEYEMYFIKEGS